MSLVIPWRPPKMSKFPVIHTSCDTGVKHDLSSSSRSVKTYGVDTVRWIQFF